jgi:hypothetical protein
MLKVLKNEYDLKISKVEGQKEQLELKVRLLHDELRKKDSEQSHSVVASGRSNSVANPYGDRLGRTENSKMTHN